ncbi:aminotransferase class V-fold PLP-dependent enzyme [Algoriphagus sp. Y33]|uniref:aminotransferase class V-fold PLP-dependent enzyme n=1 Tax=Algoriphagus sp. Y33 TaxID=2772483 RepID=UPI00178555FF|nr:aminotransferase class V-fold PLP-dependent enzyme [Algoriphagus sp. Y33]
MKSSLQDYFQSYRENIVGHDASFIGPHGEKKLVYADWIASGRLYHPIETFMLNELGPYVANTHSESSYTGKKMTMAYTEAKKTIKDHVNASDQDVIIASGAGTTAVLCKFQRILGIIYPEPLTGMKHQIPNCDRPVVFITHMEHHSNQTTWLESIADVVVLAPNADLTVNPLTLERELAKYSDRKVKIGSFTACSNVTGIVTPFHELAAIMHGHGGYCFVDFAASAPYVSIDMHPVDPNQRLDAVFFSPHKFLGGVGSSGVLVFNKELYKNHIPDHPGGGTVTWTNPWGEHAYYSDIEIREDGGTPPFLQTIRAALSIRLKEKMGVKNIAAREKELVELCFQRFDAMPELHVLSDHVRERLGVFSFYSPKIHFNLLVALLNDRYGIQVRGGCSCAGTYGHLSLQVSKEQSKSITDKIDHGDLTEKPGWVRLSLHPTMTNGELNFIMDAIQEITENIDIWKQEYTYDPIHNEFTHNSTTVKDKGDYQTILAHL